MNVPCFNSLGLWFFSVLLLLAVYKSLLSDKALVAFLWDNLHIISPKGRQETNWVCG